MALEYSDSWVGICNLALGRLGNKSIISVDPPDKGNAAAAYCQRYLPDAIDEALQYHDWIWLTKRTGLEKSVETPAFGFLYFYQLPPDLERILEVDAEGMPWRQEQDQLLTDAGTVKLAYIFRPDAQSINKVPKPLRRTIAACLTFLIAPPLTASEETIKRVAAEKEMALAIALSADGKSKQEETVATDLGVTWYDEAR